MPEKSPENIEIITHLWMLGLALFGGVVSYLNKLNKGQKWRVRDFLLELVTSAFTGIITFYMCVASDVSPTGTAAMVGIAGHFSGRALIVFGRIAGGEVATDKNPNDKS